MKIFAYKTGSRSARALAEALEVKRLKHDGSRWAGKKQSVVINWGASVMPPHLQKCYVLNRPEYVANVSNKLKFFRAMEDNPFLIPEWADTMEGAKKLLDGKSKQVVCRTKLTGHSGEGIVIASTPDELVKAPLYVQYIKKKDEYRIHVADGEVIDMQRKAKRRGEDIKDTQVRNVENGYVYVRENVNPPDCVKDTATECVRHANLLFGAVDVVYNRHYNRAFVLEINTAPGLEGQTIESYAKFFAQFK